MRWLLTQLMLAMSTSWNELRPLIFMLDRSTACNCMRPLSVLTSTARWRPSGDSTAPLKAALLKKSSIGIWAAGWAAVCVPVSAYAGRGVKVLNNRVLKQRARRVRLDCMYTPERLLNTVFIFTLFLSG